MGRVLQVDDNGVAIQNSGQSIKYQATAAADVVVKAGPGFLERIIIGKFVASGTIEVSDSVSDGDGAVKIFISGAATNIDGFPKTIEVNAEFPTGICADIVNFTDVTFIYR
jgi:hypothetical protein